MLKKQKRWQIELLYLLIILLIFIVLPSNALAAEGDGEGNTFGVFKPLGLVAVTLEDGTNVIGAENLPLTPRFTFQFDKNVVYLIYWERNTACFHLYDETGKELLLNISKIDDTADFSKRQNIWVEPEGPLCPGTTYTFYVAPDLLAKNGGSTLGMSTGNRGETFTFRTEGEEATAAPASIGVTASEKEFLEIDQQAESTDSGEAGEDEGRGADFADDRYGAEEIYTADQSEQALNLTTQSDSGIAKFQQTIKMQNIAAIIAVVAIAAWIIVEVIRRNKKKEISSKDYE